MPIILKTKKSIGPLDLFIILLVLYIKQKSYIAYSQVQWRIQEMFVGGAEKK